MREGRCSSPSASRVSIAANRKQRWYGPIKVCVPHVGTQGLAVGTGAQHPQPAPGQASVSLSVWETAAPETPNNKHDFQAGPGAEEMAPWRGWPDPLPAAELRGCDLRPRSSSGSTLGWEPRAAPDPLWGLCCGRQHFSGLCWNGAAQTTRAAPSESASRGGLGKPRPPPPVPGRSGDGEWSPDPDPDPLRLFHSASSPEA